jgi:hypothetical protein
VKLELDILLAFFASCVDADRRKKPLIRPMIGMIQRFFVEQV